VESGCITIAAHDVLLETVFFLSDPFSLVEVQPFCWKLADSHQTSNDHLADNPGELVSQSCFPLLQVLPLPGEVFAARKQRLHLKFQSHTLPPEKFPALVQGISVRRTLTLMGLRGGLVLILLETLMVLGHKGCSFHVSRRDTKAIG
jgi:hypothetical protein